MKMMRRKSEMARKVRKIPSENDDTDQEDLQEIGQGNKEFGSSVTDIAPDSNIFPQGYPDGTAKGSSKKLGEVSGKKVLRSGPSVGDDADMRTETGRRQQRHESAHQRTEKEIGSDQEEA
jgi:hypothetical protein